LINIELFLWLTHQKLDEPENFGCNFLELGGAIAPISTLGYAPVLVKIVT